jgi:hypothetical protein
VQLEKPVKLVKQVQLDKQDKPVQLDKQDKPVQLV